MFAFTDRGYPSQKCSWCPFRYFSCRRSGGIYLSSLRESASLLLFCDKAASKIPSNSTYCALLYFLRRSLRLGFWSERFPAQKAVANLLLLRSVLRFCGAWKQRCAQIERLTSPLTPSAYYPNNNSFADINRQNFVFVAAILTVIWVQYVSWAAFCCDKVKSPQSWICKIKRKTALKQRRKRNFWRTFSPNIANL